MFSLGEPTPRPPVLDPRIRNPREREPVDITALEKALRERVSGEVRFDDTARGLYAYDGSNYTQPPIGVVIPKSAGDIVAAVEVCRKYRAPVLSRGGGTSLTGSTVNIAVVIDTTKYFNHILEVNREERWARVEPGVILDDLRDAADEQGLTFGPDPSTHDRCVLGGMMGNNSCGMHAHMAGRVSENVNELDILTYDGLRMRVGRTAPADLENLVRQTGRRGEIYRALKSLSERCAPLIRQRMPKLPRRVSGYNLEYLLPENGFNIARALIGSEGTLVTILEAKLRLIYSPSKRTLVVLGFSTIADAGDMVTEILMSGPIAVEALDHKLLEYIKIKGGNKAKEMDVLPRGRAFMMVEFEGETEAESDWKARRLTDAMKRNGFPEDRIQYYDDKEKQNALWDVRESGLGATAFVPGQPDTWPGWEDAGIPPDKLGDYLRDYRKVLDTYGLDCSVYGHFSQGCVHCRIDFDLGTKRGLENYRNFIEDAADLVSRYGGSYSGEHGDGQARGELWPKMFGPELTQAMREFKTIWDPEYKMNPGKLVGDPPYLLDENLRIGTNYNATPLETHFQFPEDGGFNHATLRCVGIGKCRRTEGGYMCPSYMVTRDEEHTTRGRTHLLFDMVQGNIVKDGWKSEEVKEALDLCLACKGCKGDCPVQVDVATYKAEFLSHYYEGRVRPRYAYAMGFVHVWARLASHVPRLVNLLSHTPGLSAIGKKLCGIAVRRRIPSFATETFREWFQKRGAKNDTGRPVILWPDTFNNYFHPEVGRAAVEVLEDAGCHVIVPEANLCCGRPLYDYGFLDQAKRQLVEILDTLEQPILYGIPVVGMEPSCMAVFADELTNLFPNDERAQKLKKQTHMLGDFLEKIEYQPPAMKGTALIQGHCHQAAIFGVSAEKKILDKMGIEADVMDAGCCGLAGSFGFEEDKYDLSMKIAHRAMVPKIEESTPGTWVVADGFSCHTQITGTTDRKPVHLAQVIQMGLEKQKAGEAICSHEQGKLAEMRVNAGQYAAQAAGFVKRHPFMTILGIAAAGFGIGILAKRQRI
ncbi:MAG TPA: FAD-linked oxidase C-terminal domain-containing protein [Terriglobia bacterium]